MFQNVSKQEMGRGEYIKEQSIKIISNVFSKKYIIIYLIAFMTGTISITGSTSVFSISLLAACFSNGVPLLGVIISSCIGNTIKFGAEGVTIYILTALLMLFSMQIVKPKYNEEEKNEKLKIGKNILIATVLIQIAKSALTMFTIYDMLSGISFGIMAMVFYKIFVNSVVILEDIRERRAFSIEEVIGTSLLLAIAISSFGDFEILNFSVRNILSILIVLVLGWKNGILIGTTAGVTIGITIGIITGGEPIIIASYAISGMIAGILNKFGRLGVIVGFSLGNIVLAYVSTGFTVELIYFKEILIASIALLAIPKTIQINIEEFSGAKNLLPFGLGGTLVASKETANKLNNVTKTLKQMAKTYETSYSEEEISNIQVFEADLVSNLEEYKQNMFYDDLTSKNTLVITKIYQILVDKQELKREDFLKAFKDSNNYIVGLDDEKVSIYLENSIREIIKAINNSYKISKLNFVWNKKQEESKKTLEASLKGVTKVIENITKDIEQENKKDNKYKNETIEIIETLKDREIFIKEIVIKKQERYIIEIMIQSDVKESDIEDVLSKILKEKIVINEEASIDKNLVFISEDKYIMALGTALEAKDKKEISGDNILQTRLKDGKYLIALSDGMGSGVKANKSSKDTLEMLESLLKSGFDKQTSIDLITTSLINKNDEMFSTLDVAIVDLYTGKIEFLKSAACPTYIRNRKKVQMIKSKSLPLGIVNDKNLEIFDKDIQAGDIILMCSDGVLEANIEYSHKELWIKYILEDIDSNNTKKIADLVLKEAMDNNFGKVKDDMCVLVCKFIEK